MACPVITASPWQTGSLVDGVRRLEELLVV
jgi:hypothetical protein